MNSTEFSFTSRWSVPATGSDVWQVLSDPGTWPRWWPGIRSAQIVRHGDAHRVGERTVLRVGSPLGYTLRFGVELQSIDPMRKATARVVGDLRGTGTWSLAESAHGASMVIQWNVSATRPVIRALSFAAPLAHGWIMAAGERGLRRQVQ